jgi:hypothetical protein
VTKGGEVDSGKDRTCSSNCAGIATPKGLRWGEEHDSKLNEQLQLLDS